MAGAKADVTNVLTLAAEEKTVKAVSVMTSSGGSIPLQWPKFCAD